MDTDWTWILGVSAERNHKKRGLSKKNTHFGTQNKRLKYVKTGWILKICL